MSTEAVSLLTDDFVFVQDTPIFMECDDDGFPSYVKRYGSHNVVRVAKGVNILANTTLNPHDIDAGLVNEIQVVIDQATQRAMDAQAEIQIEIDLVRAEFAKQYGQNFADSLNLKPAPYVAPVSYINKDSWTKVLADDPQLLAEVRSIRGF